MGKILKNIIFQARLFFSSITGETKLPSAQEMEREINCHLTQLDRQFVKSTRHTLEVDYIPYLDCLAEYLGCTPRPLELIASDPRLAYALLFGPNVSYVYRLWGPHKWDGAKEAILGVGKRTDGCLTGRRVEEGTVCCWSQDRTQLVVIAASLGALVLLWLLIKMLFY
jgi:dimethylaniline monooxygenase (N-oxide forming)